MAAPINLNELEALARERLPQMVYDYYAGGANDEITIDANLRAWEAIRLRPRVLVDVANVDCSTTLLRRTIAMPVITAPCGFNGLAYSNGECVVARATTDAGTVQVLSTVSTVSLEDVAAAAPGGSRWFQLYCYRDREVTRALVQRAEAAGYEALCVTVDVPYLGRREREIRSGFHLPPGVSMKNLEPYAVADMGAAERDSALRKYVNALWDPSLDWKAIDWLRSITKLPLVLKGILCGEDATLAAEHGATGVIVSNHGGRQLDGAVSTAYALREVVQAAGDRVEVLVDGGIRRGSQVVAALAMGARAVLIGRPYLWGLAVDGEAGVRRVLDDFRNEVVLAMALCGKVRVSEIDEKVIVLPSTLDSINC